MAGAVPYYYPLVAEHDFLPYVKGNSGRNSE